MRVRLLPLARGELILLAAGPQLVAGSSLVGDHEILPSGGHVAARWRPTVLPSGGQQTCPR